MNIWGNYLNPRAVQLAEILFQFAIVRPGWDSNWDSEKYGGGNLSDYVIHYNLNGSSNAENDLQSHFQRSSG